MLSSILIIIAVYYLTPNIFSHDKISANRLLSWLLSYQVFIFFSSLVTISLLVRFLNIRYSYRISSYIFNLCWNDVLIIFLSTSVLHTAFMLAVVNVTGYSSQRIVKGINFDIVMSFLIALVMILYFYTFYITAQPKRLFKRMLKDLNDFLRTNEKEKINEQLLIIKEFFQKTNLFLDSKLLLMLNNPKVFRLFIEEEQKDVGYLEGIVDVLFESLENAILSENMNRFKETIDFLNNFVNEIEDINVGIFEKLIKGYYNLVFYNVQRLKYDQLLYILHHLRIIFETLLKKQINLNDNSKADLVEILDRLSYISFRIGLTTAKELVLILEIYVILFAYFKDDVVFYSLIKEEMSVFLFYLSKYAYNFSKEDLKKYIFKVIEEVKAYKIYNTLMGLVHIFLLALENKMYEIGYIFFSAIINVTEKIPFSIESICTFYYDDNIKRKILHLYRCLRAIKNRTRNESYEKKMYKKYMIVSGNCKIKRFFRAMKFKKPSGKK